MALRRSLRWTIGLGLTVVVVLVGMGAVAALDAPRPEDCFPDLRHAETAGLPPDPSTYRRVFLIQKPFETVAKSFERQAPGCLLDGKPVVLKNGGGAYTTLFWSEHSGEKIRLVRGTVSSLRESDGLSHEMSADYKVKGVTTVVVSTPKNAWLKRALAAFGL